MCKERIPSIGYYLRPRKLKVVVKRIKKNPPYKGIYISYIDKENMRKTIKNLNKKIKPPPFVQVRTSDKDGSNKTD